MGGLGWLTANWVNVLQGAGIVGGLLFTGIALLREGRSLRLNAVLKLTAHHRDLWSEMHRRPELGRVTRSEVDLALEPPTSEEEAFLNLAIVHFQTGWEMAVRYRMLSSEAYRRDLLEFLTLPLPRRVWDATRAHRDPRFVRFVDACLGGARSRSAPVRA